jgi:hypothetical protein
MNTVSELEAFEITEPQRMFAERERAVPGIAGPRGVFFYQTTPLSTVRWLVDPDGHILESVSFNR